MMEEIWKDIPDFEGIYQVSNLGRVRSLDRTIEIHHPAKTYLRFRPGRIIRLFPNPKGYINFVANRDNEQQNIMVHRLVAQAFVPNPDNLPEVNHRDENKANNRADNLEWTDRLTNVRHGSGIERGHDALRRPVIQMTKDGEFIKEWSDICAVNNELGIDRKSISRCCRGMYGHKTAGGYRWKFKE